MYLSYVEYQNMGGTLDEPTFNDLAFEAQAQIDWYTFSRLQNDIEYPEAVKRCMYRLIKLIQDGQSASVVDPQSTQESAIHAGIASQSNDGVSISYNVLSASEVVANSKAEIEMCVKQYLQGVKNSLGRKVLYRGLYQDE